MAAYLPGATLSLRKVFRPLTSLWYKVMGPPNSEDIFPSKEIPVDYWKSTLSRLPQLKDEPHLLDIRDKSVVTTLWLCKAKGVSKHEYLVAELRQPGGRVVYARIERFRADPKLEKKRLEEYWQKRAEGAKAQPRHTSSGSNSRQSSSSYSSEHMGIAKDTVRCSNERILGGKVAKRYEFTRYQPTVVDLAIAAFVAHEHDSLYSLFTHQCYWYADVICAILENIVGKGNYSITKRKDRLILKKTDVYLTSTEKAALAPSSGQGHRDWTVQAIVCPENLSEWTNLKVGHNIIKICTRQQQVVDMLLREFHKVQDEFKNKEDIAKADKKTIEEFRKRTERDQETIERQRREIEQLKAARAQLPAESTQA